MGKVFQDNGSFPVRFQREWSSNCRAQRAAFVVIHQYGSTIPEKFVELTLVQVILAQVIRSAAEPS
jgi:hypothetical protein